MPDPDPVPPVTPPAEPPVAPPVPPAIDPSSPEFKDAVKAAVDEQLKEVLLRMAPHNAAPVIPQADPLEAIAQELAQEEKISLETAKSFVKKFVRINEHLGRGTQEELQAFKLKDRFAQVFGTYPGSEKLAPRMAEVFKTLSPMEQNFVLNSPRGAQFIYDEAKRTDERYALPPDARAAVGNPPARTPTPERKLGGKAELFAKANEAMATGNRKVYEETMDQIKRG